MPVWFQRRPFVKMSQDDIPVFSSILEKNTTDFISTSSRIICAVFVFSLTDVFDVDFGVFALS
jgi:hypothetical protein